LVGAQRAPTAAMCENANTNRSGAIGGLYLRSRTSRQAAFGGQSNRLFVVFVVFVVRKTPFLRCSC